jgi:ribosomal protein RSM22 (predicted rRNA methylase)
MADPRLPEALRAALDGLPLGGDATARRSAAALSTAYRAMQPSSGALAGEDDVAAYAATRMPATYAAIQAALAEAAARLEAFAPETLLDAGAGPGTASWAATTLFPGLTRVTQLDHNAGMLGFGEALAASEPRLAQAERVTGSLVVPPLGQRRFDLVVAGYALTELPDSAVVDAALGLWHHCDGLLLIVEPGRTRDYGRLMAARSALFDAGAQIVAPCPHQAPCPLPAGDWCHFSVRLPRSKAHRRLKGGSLGYEDEKFSYLTVARSHLRPAPAAARVLRPPLVRKFAVELTLCARSGLEQRAVTRQEGGAYKAAKKLTWGDALD